MTTATALTLVDLEANLLAALRYVDKLPRIAETSLLHADIQRAVDGVGWFRRALERREKAK